MPSRTDYPSKFAKISEQTLFPLLSENNRRFIAQTASRYHFTLQELRVVAEIARDLEMWNEREIETLWPAPTPGQKGNRQEKQRMISELSGHWQTLKQETNEYPRSTGRPRQVTADVALREKGKLGLGYCPVASPKTRCCNLLTLDAVDNCGYGCSYCSIQSFFSNDQVFFDPGFADKLETLTLDPEKIYHIGTGQSSDSLMWGNSHGVLDAELKFARQNPNVILEFKTKSANVGHLLKSDLPANILFTWSLNTDTIIRNEEHGSAPLEKRLDAARRLAEKGAVVGFHFHPMIHYAGWQAEYGRLFEQLQSMFDPEQVAMISLGTLTFIKPVIRKIRQLQEPSQILKMPLQDAEGKLSYPEEIKLALFSHAYQSFNHRWHEEVFFYLCMENHNLWQPVFGIEYPTNEAFEKAMKHCYLGKIEHARSRQKD